MPWVDDGLLSSEQTRALWSYYAEICVRSFIIRRVYPCKSGATAELSAHIDLANRQGLLASPLRYYFTFIDNDRAAPKSLVLSAWR